MPLETAPRRTLVFGRYVRALKTHPITVIDYLVGHIAIVSNHLPVSVRRAIAERLRDLADHVENAHR
jgi:hypothetical protein